MDEDCLTLNTNWQIQAGCELSKAAQIQEADTDVFIRPSLEDLAVQEKAILLSKPDTSTEKCDLIVQIFPRYKIQAFNMMCNVPKVEIFQGPLREYFETIYGQLVNDSDDNGELVCYRYDVEIEKSGITDIAIRFITHMTEIFICGLRIHRAPNPHGITTLVNPAGSGINIEIVQNILKNNKERPSPGQKKCMELFESLKFKSNCNMSATNANNLIHPGCSQMKPFDHSATTGLNTSTNAYIELRFKALEESIQRLTEIEQQQNAKLDKILKIIEKQKCCDC